MPARRAELLCQVRVRVRVRVANPNLVRVRVANPNLVRVRVANANLVRVGVTLTLPLTPALPAARPPALEGAAAGRAALVRIESARARQGAITR